MNLTNKRSYVHKARKSDNYKYDLDEKDKVRKILLERFGLYAFEDEVITWSEEHRYPDLFIKSEQTAIELDGEGHGFGDDITTTDKTWKRNRFYEDIGMKLIIINKAVTEYEEDKIIQCLELHGLEKKSHS